jgi:hypothetical protein
MLRRMLEALDRKMSGFLTRILARKISDVERELEIARKHPDVSLKDVKSAEKAVAEAREAIRKE